MDYNDNSDGVFSTFYYSRESELNSIDNDKIVRYMVSNYPNLSKVDDQIIIKQTLISMFDNEVFVRKILTMFGMTFKDFVQFVIGKYQKCFNTYFVKKIVPIINAHNYGQRLN